jgi:CheY-like chemotaxis protein
MVLRVAKEKKIYLTASQLDDNNCLIGIKDSRNAISQKLTDDLYEIFTKDEDTVRQNYGLSRLTIRLTRMLLDILSADYKLIKNSKGESKEFGLVFPFDLEKEGIIESQQTDKFEEKETPEIGSAEIGTSFEKSPPAAQESNPSPETQQPERKPDSSSFEEVELKENQQETKTPVDVTKIDCLYLEDQIDSQILLKAQLKDFNSLEFASSFEEALPKLKSKHFDLIIMDINLKGSYNGLDALRMIQRMPGYQKVPIIAVTAYSMPGDKENFTKAGFSDYISKPLSREKILESVEAVM